jgi:hypothetical protein
VVTIKIGRIKYQDRTPWAIGARFIGWWVYYLPETGKWFLSTTDLFIVESAKPTFAGIIPEP